MNTNESILSNSRDHILANTWRLIFEHKLQPATVNLSHPVPDFNLLEQLLFEYRLIGLSLAERKRHPLN
jgi:hypothetical protein